MIGLFNKLKSEKANSMVENVIILPLIFIILYALILTCFMIHDRSTVEAAAKRGAIYAAHCVSDPNYANILSQSGNNSGSLDTNINISKSTEDNKIGFSFTGIAKNIQAYRYITSGSMDIEGQVEKEVTNIVDNTRIPWRELEVDDVDFNCTNYVFYQDLSVTVKADYPIPEFFGVFGLDTEYEYSVTAKMAVTDPDEFIRNADLVVDLITDIDGATGGNLEKVKNKITELGDKVFEWFDMGK